MSTQLTADQLLHAYRVMRTIRVFEERLHVEFATGEIPGFVHLYAGEEASAAGVMAHLGDDDCIASNHRGHGHCIAKGVDVYGMMAEIYGKKTGVCQGKGGSMHIADFEKGMLGAMVAQFERAPGAVDHTENFVVAAQALLAVQLSIQERRVVPVEPEFPFTPC